MSRESKNKVLLCCSQLKGYSGIFMSIAEQASQVLTYMPAGSLLREKDGQVTINSMLKVKSNFLHQSQLVAEGILFRTSQFVSEAHMQKPFKHSNTVYKEHMKQEEKIEALEAGIPVSVEVDGQRW